MDGETRFLLRRASQEARRAISSEYPGAAAVHEEMSRRYSNKAVALLLEGDSSASAKSLI